jgi:hypothetical protein
VLQQPVSFLFFIFLFYLAAGSRVCLARYRESWLKVKQRSKKIMKGKSQHHWYGRLKRKSGQQ